MQCIPRSVVYTVISLLIVPLHTIKHMIPFQHGPFPQALPDKRLETLGRPLTILMKLPVLERHMLTLSTLDPSQSHGIQRLPPLPDEAKKLLCADGMALQLQRLQPLQYYRPELECRLEAEHRLVPSALSSLYGAQDRSKGLFRLSQNRRAV